MIKNYLLISLRSVMKNKMFIIINVFGMGIAIGCCVVGYLALEYDADFDKIHVNRDQVYRVSAVRTFENKLTPFGYAPFPLGEIADKTMDDVSASSRYYLSHANFKLQDDLFAANLTYVEPDFFQMFSFDFVAGSPNGLKDKSSVFISENMAGRLFRTPAEAFGKTITQVYGNELKELKVAGIFRDPVMNSSFYKRGGSSYVHFENCKDEYPRLTDDNWMQESTLYVRVNEPSRLSAVHQQLQTYVANNNKAREDFQVSEYRLDSFATMAHNDRTEDVSVATWQAPPLSAVVGSMVMAVLILLIACFNLTNTAIAISSQRLKEIGLRKVMGGSRKQLVVQFIGETTFVCFLALLAGLGFADILIQGWNLMTADNIHISPHYTPSFITFLAGTLLFTGILAGSYPAFYISKFNPVKILKGKLQFGGTSYFTRILLGAQFAISLIAVVSAIGFFQNAQYQRKYDLGFDARGCVIAWVNGKSEFDTYRNALQDNHEILSVAGASSGIFSSRAHDPIKHGTQQAEVDIIGVGDNYLKTMNLQLLEGRDFIADSETDLKESIIISQKMAKLFGWEHSLGKEVIWKDSVKLIVVGVIKDVYTRGLWHEMGPLMIRYVKPEYYTQLVVNARAENIASVNAFMNKQWHNTFPNRLYNGFMLSSTVQQVDDLNKSIMYGYSFLGVIALLLSLTGLFSMVSLNIVRKLKEIGVRKVLGASVLHITKVINMEFIIILTVASVLGSWAGIAWSGVIMGSIWKYYQGVNITTVSASVALIFAISLATIGYKVFSVAIMNPVKTLRDE